MASKIIPGAVRGRFYEESCQHILHSRLGMKLRHTGKAYDKGLDFIGSWLDDGSGNSLKIIGQCKFYSSKVGARVVREFIGASMPYIAKGDPLLGVFCISGVYTQHAINATISASIPLLILSMPKQDSPYVGEDWCRSATLNNRASQMFQGRFQIREVDKHVRNAELGQMEWQKRPAFFIDDKRIDK